MVERRIGFAGRTVAIRSEGAHAAALVDRVFARVPPGLAPPELVLHLSEAGSERFSMARHDSLVFRDAASGLAASSIVEEVTLHLADACTAGPVFHAAAVGGPAGGILLPGTTGSGKTTLSAWLTRRGFDYLSDELACVHPADLRIEAFARPLQIRTAVRPVLAREGAVPSTLWPCRLDAEMVLPDQLGPPPVDPTPPARLIVFPRYDPESPGELVRIEPARAAFRLLSSLLNARRLPARGVREVAHLARRVPAWELRYATFTHVEPHLAIVRGRCRNE